MGTTCSSSTFSFAIFVFSFLSFVRCCGLQKQTEEEEEYVREQARYEKEAREAQDKF